MADPKAENNVQHFLAKIAGAEETAPVPQTNVEHYLAKIAGEDVDVPEDPSTTEEYYLDKIAEKELVEAEPLNVERSGTYTAPTGKAYSPVTVPAGSISFPILAKEQVDNNTIKVSGTLTARTGFLTSGSLTRDTTVQASEVTAGTKNINTNGTHDVTNFKSAQVAVPQTTVTPLSVTENGTYTASSGVAYNPVTVNVSGSNSTTISIRVTSTTKTLTFSSTWIASNIENISGYIVYCYDTNFSVYTGQQLFAIDCKTSTSTRVYYKNNSTDYGMAIQTRSYTQGTAGTFAKDTPITQEIGIRINSDGTGQLKSNYYIPTGTIYITLII